jgi:PAS domain S-box-containing protein
VKKTGVISNIDQRLLGLLMSSIKDHAIFMLDPKGNIISWNKGAENIKGYTGEEIIGKHICVFYTTEDNKKNEPQRNLNEALVKGSFESEGLRVRKDGSTFWADVVFTALYNDHQKLLGFAKVTSDITARRRAEHSKEKINIALEKKIKENSATKELEDLLNRAIILARIGSWEVNVVNETVYWSDITREIHEAGPGYHPDINAAINFYKEGEDRKTIVKTMEDAITHGIPGDVELQIVTAKGGTKWVRVIVEAEFAGGKCLSVYGSLQDITARKNAEILAIETLEERNTILESIDDAFFAVDKNWTVTYWNNMAEKVLQTPKNVILNHNLWDIFSGSTDSLSYKKYHQAVATNKAAHFEDYFQPLKKWFEISAYPSESGLTVYFKDISDRKLSDALMMDLNENLQKQAKELAISNAELEQFAYVASHDLQEPLRMVTSFMTQLEKKYGDVIDDKGRQYIHFAVDGAKRMRQIILDLLDFSRVGRTEDDLEEIDFNKLINEIMALYRRQIEEELATITFENLPAFQTYKTPIRQVFQNLISNSLKYHRAGISSVISISCKETKTHFQFSVKDNGIGIAPEYFDKIFIIFQRLHNKDEYSGTGMGLAIAKKIVENLGGKIWVRSEDGKGSTFYFTLLKTIKT